MRLTVMAAERAATMATTIHSSCRNVGQPWLVARAASSAPVKANGKANTECSNLIISSTVPRGLVVMAGAASRLGLLGCRRAQPAIHLVLRQSDLRQPAAYVLGNQGVDGSPLIIKRRNRRHHQGTGLLRAQHVLQMNAAERRVADAQHQLAVFFEH